MVEGFAIGAGVFIALLLGSFCKCFLKKSVAATPPDEVRLTPRSQEDGGSKELGTLEILLFFGSLWFTQFAVVAGAWLATKVAAKWAAWQHISKIPDKSSSDSYLLLRDRLRFSNHLLGSFLNGTLYNVFCAGVGVGVGKVIVNNADALTKWSLPLECLSIVFPLVASLFGVWCLFGQGPGFCEEESTAKDEQAFSNNKPMSFAIRTFIQITSLILTLEAAFFLAKGNLGLSAENSALLAATRFDYNPELVESLAQQSADTWVGVVLLLVAFLLQMGNALWPVRIGDWAVHKSGALFSVLFCVALGIGAFYVSKHVASNTAQKVKAILTSRGIGR